MPSHRLTEDQLDSIYRFTDPKSGVSAEPRTIHSDLDGRHLVEGHFQDASGGKSGFFSRSFYPTNTGHLVADHDYFELHSKAQDNGFSKRWLAHNFEQYAQHGVRYAKLHANIDIGAYAWHQHGFVPNADDTRYLQQQWKRDIDDDLAMGELSPQEHLQAQSLTQPHEFANFDVGRRFPIHTNAGMGEGHYGKAFYLRRPGRHEPRDWHGTLDLSPDNPHYQRGVAYRNGQQQRQPVTPEPKPAPSQPRVASPEPLARSQAGQPPVRDRLDHYHCRAGHTHRYEGLHRGTGSDAHLFDGDDLAENGDIAPSLAYPDAT